MNGPDGKRRFFTLFSSFKWVHIDLKYSRSILQFDLKVIYDLVREKDTLKLYSTRAGWCIYFNFILCDSNQNACMKITSIL